MSDCKIILCSPWTEESLTDLYLLYLPLMDHEAIGLYQVLRIMAEVSLQLKTDFLLHLFFRTILMFQQTK